METGTSSVQLTQEGLEYETHKAAGILRQP